MNQYHTWGTSELIARIYELEATITKMKELEQKELRVYMIEVDEECGSDDYTDEDFMTLAEKQGTVYSLKRFQDEFNYTENISQSYYIRFI